MWWDFTKEATNGHGIKGRGQSPTSTLARPCHGHYRPQPSRNIRSWLMVFYRSGHKSQILKKKHQ